MVTVLPEAAKSRGPRSLKRMALTVAIRNIAAISDLGDLSFAEARPLLVHVENPHQLRLLEERTPQLAAEPTHMADLWTRLLDKQFPGYVAKGYLDGVDATGSSWFDIHQQVKAAADRDMAAATARLQQTLAGFDKAKEDHATQFVNNRALLRKMPGMGSSSGARRRAAGAAGGSPVLRFGGGSRTKMTTGQSVLKRARREAREIGKMNALSTPTSQLRVAQNQIRSAPAAMVHDHRVAHQTSLSATGAAAAGMIRAPKRRTSGASHGIRSFGGSSSSGGSSGGSSSIGGSSGSGSIGVSAAEARLLALKNGSKPTKNAAPPLKGRRGEAPSSIKSDGGGGGDDDDDDDDLFGDEPSPKKARLTVDDLERTTAGIASPVMTRATTAPTSKASRTRASKPAPSPAPARVLKPPAAPPTLAAGSATKKRDVEATPSLPKTVPSRPSPFRKKAPVDIFMRQKKR
ncbi:RNA polymerase 2 transcription factor siii subunit [Niveomyces insectorum RCEF 264]|uniref:RNA polymerase 2 transcription factor siii subunit n=1 Tax=Niveomyces insectorum RCEF 264 TaxID=1081102 RepID=A0A167TVJ8_9HYPO|nr:RNA polymerase 2 transcription factor siii subunit [Niveomyces insectorum RCEF 264]